MFDAVDVMVIGGGIVGLSAAIAMRQRNFSVTVLDAGPLTTTPRSTSARVYAINSASEQLLTSLDVWPLIDKQALSPYRQMQVWDAKQDAQIDFDARMIGADRLGYLLDDTAIKSALLKKAGELAIKLIPNCQVNQIDIETNTITSNLKNHGPAKLLIIADGAQSTARDLLKVPLTTWSYHQKAIVATVQTEKMHQQTAYQVFHQTGPLAFLPLSNPYESSIVWSTSPEKVDQLMNLSDDTFGEALTEAFGTKLGTTKIISKRHQFPLQMRHVKQYSGATWLLIGDAAHTIHPLAGLGLNVGLADLSAWLTLIDANALKWTARELSCYQRQRKHALWQTIALMQGLHLLFTSALLPVVALRGLGLNLCNRLLPLKRLMIEHASGSLKMSRYKQNSV